MIYTEEFITNLPSDTNIALKRICEHFNIFDSNVPYSTRVDEYDEYLDAYALLEVFIKSKSLNDEIQKLDSSKFTNIDIIRKTFNDLLTKYEKLINLDQYEFSKNRYQGFFQNVFTYEFTAGDLERIQKLINELRESISKSPLFEENHRERLLNKLEGLQKELHKRVSSLDKFWGLIGDAGVAIGKFGTDAKPFVDRMKEIADIIWRTQAKAEELPSGSNIPLLNSPEQEIDA